MDEGGTGLVDKIETLKCSMTKERKAGREREETEWRAGRLEETRRKGFSSLQLPMFPYGDKRFEKRDRK